MFISSVIAMYFMAAVGMASYMPAGLFLSIAIVAVVQRAMHV
jgi:hypothetical protein